MYDPRFRLVILVSTMLVVGVVANVLYNYTFGPRGLNWNDYIHGVVRVGGSIIGGFLFVWVCTKFITFSQYRKTGFEAAHTDETGTTFYPFPVSLSKYLPDIVAPPQIGAIHPLEAELVGFLNGYRHWPFDITGKDPRSLYQHTMDQWQAMCTLKGASSIHRIGVLAVNLGKVYVYEEKRKRFPAWMFWKRDKISFRQRCLEHGGISSFVLSTMPSFRFLGGDDYQTNQRLRRALLTAVRYAHTPTYMPANCDPLSREIYEYVHRAGIKADQMAGKDMSSVNPTDAQIEELNEEIISYFQQIVRDLDINPANLDDDSDGAYVGKGMAIVGFNRFVRRFAPVLEPNIRSTFNLWENLSSLNHPSWPYLIEGLRTHNLLIEEWEDIQADEGLFNLKLNNLHLPKAVILNIDANDYPGLRAHLDSLPRWTGLVELTQNKEALLKEIQSKSKAVDDMLASLEV